MKRINRDILVLLMAHGIRGFAAGAISAFVSLLLYTLGASFLQVGYVSSLYNIALATAAFTGGLLTSRYGGRVIFMASLIFSLAAVISYNSANLLSSWLIVAAGLVFGQIAWGLRDTASFSIVSSSASPELRGTSLGMTETVLEASGIIGPIVGGVIAYYYGLQNLFFMAMLLIATAVLLILWKLKKGQVNTKKPLPSLAEIKESIMHDSNILILFLACAWLQFFMEFGNPYYTIYMKASLNAPDFVIGLTESALAAGSLITGLPIGFVSDRVKDPRKLIVFAFLIEGCGVINTALATSPWMPVVTFFLFGVANVVYLISVQAYFSDVGGQRKELLFGIWMATIWVSGILSPSVAGMIAQKLGLRFVFEINFAGMLGAIVMLLLLFKPKRHLQSRPIENGR